MGGYAFDMAKLGIDFASHQAKRLTLSPEGLIHLAENEGHIVPDISEEHIRDKSKADGFAKTVVCIQALWFLTQVVGRLAIGYPISLLEMNTLLHALCCLIIYAAWWHKPLDVEETSLVDKTEGLTACREMVWRSKIWFYRSFLLHGPGCQSSPRRAQLTFLLNNPLRNVRYGHKSQSNHLEQDSEDPRCRRLYVGQSFRDYCVDIRWSGHNLSWWIYRIRFPMFADACYVCLSQADLEALAHAPADLDLVRQEAPPFFWNHTSLDIFPDSFAQRFRLFEGSDVLYLYGFGLTASGSAYAGVHLIAWHNAFPSVAETFVWRVSCLIIVSSLVVFLTILTGSLVSNSYHDRFPVKDHPGGPQSIALRDQLIILFLLLLVIYAVLYVAARAYLVAESFRCLGYMPVEVYKEPEWSKYFPHFGAG
jgi:hypothetical protein